MKTFTLILTGLISCAGGGKKETHPHSKTYVKETKGKETRVKHSHKDKELEERVKQLEEELVHLQEENEKLEALILEDETESGETTHATCVLTKTGMTCVWSEG